MGGNCLTRLGLAWPRLKISLEINFEAFLLSETEYYEKMNEELKNGKERDIIQGGDFHTANDPLEDSFNQSSKHVRIWQIFKN